MSLVEASSLNIAVAVFLLLVVYCAAIAIYRVLFHPLSRFPGPRLAAVSTLYRAYYQVWRDGDHIAQFTRLHTIYGPVVRIAPNTLHFRNPRAFNDIFKFSSRFTKDGDFYDHLGQSEALFGMIDEEEHKKRFRLVADLFSKKSAQDFEPLIHINADRLCCLLSTSARNGPTNIARALRAVALDIIQDFVFDHVPSHLRGLRDEKFDTLFVDTTFDVMDWTAWCFRNFPFTLVLSNYTPQWLRRRILPGEAANVESFNTILGLVNSNVVAGPVWKRDSLLSRMANKVTLTSLTSECMGTMFGGVINLANMLPYGTFMACNVVAMQEKLYQELRAVWPNLDSPTPRYEVLKELPLLNGIVNETLRHMHGIITGPPRVVPSPGAEIDGYFIPAKTVVSTSSLYCHMNPGVFVEPEEFKPERWLRPTPEMERSLVPFSKGRRMCPGKEISLMELYIVFAALFRRFEIAIYNTTRDDFDWKVYISLHFKGRPFHAHLHPRRE